MIGYFQKRAYEKALKSLCADRKASILDFNKIKNIAVIFEVTDETSYVEILGIIEELRKQQKKIAALAYFDGKKLPEYSEDSLSLSHLSKNDIKGYAFPKGEYADNFFAADYDLLISFDRRKTAVLYYSFAKITAKCKAVPYHSEYEKYADFMISIDDENFDNILYVKELMHYLHNFSNK
ncbi:MAG TPA: hypothetical protein ENN45_02205 [Bacteroidetes bacterium]|nr:hypothetical protein [Bacteroidota bacterium]